MAGTSNRKPTARGVTWDKRTGRYRARIMVEGRQTYLGSFETEAEAAAAYRAVKAPRREVAAVQAERPASVAERMEVIKAQAAAQWRGRFRGKPVPVRFEVEGYEFGDTFSVERAGREAPQVYTFRRKVFRKFGGKVWAFWVWSSFCVADVDGDECGEAFEVELPGDVERMGLPSPCCKAHRKAGRPKHLPGATSLAEGGGMAVSGDPGGAAGAFEGVMEGLREALMDAARLAGIDDLV